MIKDFFLPTDCRLCYWGRMALIAFCGVAIGTFTGTYWSLVLPGLVAVLCGAAKWLITKYS